MKHGCFGCCGCRTGTKGVLWNEIRRHTKEHREAADRVAFLRRGEYLTPGGICYNVGLVEGKTGCLVYDVDPEVRRSIGCEVEFECETLRAFLGWDRKRRRAFGRFVESLDLDRYAFSEAMRCGEILVRFLETTLRPDR
jgi:hypothetical protein